MISFLLSFLPVAQLATLAALLYYRGKAARLQGRLDEANQGLKDSNAKLIGLNAAVTTWKVQAAAAKGWATNATADANTIREKYQALLAATATEQVPADPAGAIDWMRDKAKGLQ